MQYRPEIDGLRAIAVLPVIFFHAGFETFSGGFVGVDVFFVISGFLITSILLSDLERGSFSIANFYERRARRILPALFFVMACCIPVAVALMIPMQLEKFAASVLAVVFFVSNFFFWRETGYFAPAAEEQPLLHTWSLSVEEQFYVLFPLALAGLWRQGRTRALLVFAIVTVISIVGSEVASRLAPAASFYLLPTRAWELLAGALCAFFLKSGAAFQYGSAAGGAALGGIALIAGAIFAFDETTPTPSILVIVPVLGACLVILFAHPSSIAARLLSWKPMVAVGLVSYSAYLWHQPLLAFVRIASNDPPSQVVLLAVVFGTLALAALTWRYIELPFRRDLRSPIVLRATAYFASVLVVASLAVIFSHGLRHYYVTHRLDPDQAVLFERVQKQIDAGMERNLFDDGACRFIASAVDFTFRQRFATCAKQYGPGVVLVGDSHAMNIYNILAKAQTYPFLAAVARGGCRPHTPRKDCHYEGFDAWALEARQDIKEVIYHQSGSYFLRDENGKVDSKKAFTAGAQFNFAEDNLRATAGYLNDLARIVPVTWLGPFVEARIRFEDLQYLSTGLFMNETSLAHFQKLDELLISFHESKNDYRYLSLIDFLDLTPNFLLVGDCVTYRDVDHFSACGEELLAQRDWRTLFERGTTSQR